MILEWLIALLLVGGAFFALVSTIGLLRMPDLPTRMHATTKAGAFGAGLMLVAVAIFFADIGVTTRVIATILFIMLTAPVAAHVIARAAYIDGIPLWSGTLCDQLKDHYELSSGHLDGAESDDEIDAASAYPFHEPNPPKPKPTGAAD